MTAFSTTLIRLYQHYQHQILPFAGGILDQPNPYIQAMEILSGYLNERTDRQN